MLPPAPATASTTAAVASIATVVAAVQPNGRRRRRRRRLLSSPHLALVLQRQRPACDDPSARLEAAALAPTCPVAAPAEPEVWNVVTDGGQLGRRKAGPQG